MSTGGTTFLPRLFTASKRDQSNKSQSYTCTASEALLICNVLAFFVQTIYIAKGVAVKECKAYLAFLDIIDMILAIPLRKVSPRNLRTD